MVSKKAQKTLVAVLFSLTLIASSVCFGENPHLKGRSVGEYLQAISVNIQAGPAQGSGTIFIIPVEGENHAFILTAAHVVRHLRRTREYHDQGDRKTAIYYDDATVVQEQLSKGRVVGKVSYDAKVLTVDSVRDIALLLVRKPDAFQDSGYFYPHDIVPVGTAVFHCGAPGGIEIGGSASLTNGIISRLGVKITDYTPSEYAVFDQVTCPALGGSSGGLVATCDEGAFVGMITLGLSGSSNFSWMVPIRMIRRWVQDLKIEWLMEPEKKVTWEQIHAIPLEVEKPQVRTGVAKEEIESEIIQRIR